MKSNSTNLGSYLGAILTLTLVLFYAVDLDLFLNGWINLITFFLIIIFGVFSIKKEKKILNGFINFKSAFTCFFLTTVIGVGISTAASIIVFGIIDTDAANYLNELQLEKSIEISKKIMEWFSVPKEVKIEELSKLQNNTPNNYTIGAQFTSYIFSLAFFSLIGLIVAAIMKKRDQSQV